MTSLTFHGGVNEVGGNKILIESNGARIFLDFGMSFYTANTYFSEFLQPRKCNGIFDFIEFGLLPKMDGIYRNDFLRHCGLPATDEPSIEGVFLSHAHLDHSAYIPHLHPDIPVYCGEVTLLILKALQDTGSGSFRDYVVYAENFETRNYRAIQRRDRRIQTFRMGEIINIGELLIEPIYVDHSIPDAYGFIIETKEGNIVYTGDLRFHGYKGETTREFVERAKEADPVALICEGTNLQPTRVDRKERYEEESEHDVKTEISRVISNTNGMVIANFPPRDIDRLVTFYEAARENDRKLVLNFKQAYLLELLKYSELDTPTIEDRNILIYGGRKDWGTIIDPSRSIAEKRKDYSKWERDFLEHQHCVTCKDVNEMQEDVIFYCDFFSLKELIDLRPIKGSCYVWSKCEPFTEDMVLEEKQVNAWLKHFGLYPMHKRHASGHAFKDELGWMVEEIKPEKVYPVHTERPDMFRHWSEDVQMLQKGKEYPL